MIDLEGPDCPAAASPSSLSIRGAMPVNVDEAGLGTASLEYALSRFHVVDAAPI